ncbi:MAG: dethiobiotin synthase [Candidatus Sumerlaeia bacterium]|nr:dethiobiotin synthase [Candidatus Sumerlaeia bacterium]
MIAKLLRRHGVLAVTGTDTDAGKTRCCVALLRSAAREGLAAAAVKPVASGGEFAHGVWRHDDALALHAAMEEDARAFLRGAGVDPAQPLLAFREPMAPVSAALLEGRKLPLGALRRRLGSLAEAAREERMPLLIEGVGGALVPLSRKSTFADLVADLGVPALVVGRTHLGAINHMLLTLEALASRGVPVAAVVLSRTAPDVPPEIERSAFREIRPRLPARAPFLLLRHGSESFEPVPRD